MFEEERKQKGWKINTFAGSVLKGNVEIKNYEMVRTW